MKRTELFDINISDISATSLSTLYCRALESISKGPILDDPKAVELMEQLNLELSDSENKLHRRFAAGKIRKSLIVHIALRAKKYDEYVRDFLNSSLEGVVVNIGCGFDTRFWRVDNGEVIFYDLDFPEIIEIKKKFLKESERYRYIPSSVLEFDWMIPLLKHDGPFIFIAEGVFMYLERPDVKSLFLNLQSNFPGCELVCEVVNSRMLGRYMKKLVDFKLQKQLSLGAGATYNFGIRNSREMEGWNQGIEFLDEWDYFETREQKLGLLRLLGRLEMFRRVQWTVHYQLVQPGN